MRALTISLAAAAAISPAAAITAAAAPAMAASAGCTGTTTITCTYTAAGTPEYGCRCYPRDRRLWREAGHERHSRAPGVVIVPKAVQIGQGR